ncbi:MAG: glycosyltransferase family 2 protein [Acidobacteriota bacterium]
MNTINLDISVWVALVLGLGMVLCLWRSHRHYRALLEIRPLAQSEASSVAHPDCMVVIPARNEEGNVGLAVRRLPPDSVIVVDDFSDDKTADEARESGAGVLQAPELLDGAVGKSNACMEGARVLTSRWILFADADVRFEPGAVNALVAAVEGGQFDFLSVYLKPEFLTISESVIAPYGVALFFSGINPGANPASAFNGQCVLVKRDAYEFVGGHRALLSHVCEDVQMAALAERHRMKFAVARATMLGSVRIRPDDFERNASRFVLVSLWTGAWVALMAAAWALWLPALALLIVNNETAVALAWAVIPSVLLGPWYGWKRAILAPIGIYAILPRLFHGAVGAMTNRHFEWKGRVI